MTITFPSFYKDATPIAKKLNCLGSQTKYNLLLLGNVEPPLKVSFPVLSYPPFGLVEEWQGKYCSRQGGDPFPSFPRKLYHLPIPNIGLGSSQRPEGGSRISSLVSIQGKCTRNICLWEGREQVSRRWKCLSGHVTFQWTCLYGNNSTEFFISPLCFSLLYLV